MTREEEIKQAAQAYYPSGSLYEERTVSAFVRGAKWADENPQGMSKMRKDYEFLFMLKKRELIEKACEWIKNNKHLYKELSFGSLNIDWDKFIREFRKAMEE